MKNRLRNQLTGLMDGILDTYATTFYSQNKGFGFLLLLASFFYPPAGFCGLLSLITAYFIAQLLNYKKEFIADGTLTYNSLLVGVGLGMMYQISFLLLICILFASSIALLATILIWNVSSRYQLPFLSLPFLITFWIVLPSLHYFQALKYNIPVVYYIDFLTQLGGARLVTFYTYYNNNFLPLFISSYFKTLSVLFFQNNVFTGFLIAIAILYHSRIAFTLTLLGYSTAYLFYTYAGIDLHQLTQFHAGFNYLIVPVAIGSFYTIPSKRSYIMALIAGLASVLISLGINDTFMKFGASAYSLPFVITIYLVLTALKFRVENKNPKLVTYQYFSPEKNLYKQQYYDNRFPEVFPFPIQLPFFGEWMVTQSYDGKHTHKGDWAHALDFIIVDNELKQYQGSGLKIEDYYCYNKPVMSPGDGWVSVVINEVEDNEIGAVNMLENWGNTVIIYHAEGLYSQLSHLKKDTIQFKVGDFIKKGDLIARCGNSGRSPVPHLHFQFQATQKVGDKTLPYSISNFIEKNSTGEIANTLKKSLELKQNTIPSEGVIVQNIASGKVLKESFNFIPGQQLKWSYQLNGLKKGESWECFTDSLNYTYWYCKQTGSTAYFVQNGSLFYFTDFEGDKNSLLYYFYLGASKLSMGYFTDLTVTDTLPLNLFINRSFFWNDFIAPFYNLVTANYSSEIASIDDLNFPSKISLKAVLKVNWLNGLFKNKYDFEMICADNKLQQFSVRAKQFELIALCVD